MNWEQLYADLRHAEGQRDRVYDDATGAPIGPGSHVIGHPTIGVGHRLDQPMASTLIDAILDWDVSTTLADLDRNLPWWRHRSDGQQRALVELAFTMGITGLLHHHRFLTHLQSGESAAAAGELEQATWTLQVGPTRSQRVLAQVRA